MAEFSLIYKMVKLLDDNNNRLADDDDMEGFAEESGDWALLATRDELLKEYSESNHTSTRTAERIIKAAIRLGYIEVVPMRLMAVNDRFRVTSLGDNFLLKRWFIPTGFLKEILNDNQTLINISATIITCILTAINIYQTTR